MMYYGALQTALVSMQSLLTGLASLYEDNLFLTYFYEFMSLEPHLQSPAEPKPVPRPMREGVVFDEVTFQYPETARTALDKVSLQDQARRGGGAGGAQRLRQDDAREVALPAVRPSRGRHHRGRDRPPGVRPGRAAREHERDLPGLLAIPALRSPEHLDG